MEQQNLYEYQMLREEIIENLKTQNSLSVSIIGLTITILTLISGLDIQNACLNLLPLLILLPAAVKTRELKHSISIISSYLSVRYESAAGIYWETAYNRYRLNYHPKRPKAIVFLQNCEYGMAGCICLVFYCGDVLADLPEGSALSALPVPMVLLGAAAALVVLWTFVITFDYGNMDAGEINADNGRWYEILSQNQRKN